MLTVALQPDQLDELARRVTALIREGRDDGFLDVNGAAHYLSTSVKSINHLVERGQLPHHRAGSRLLFDQAELRAWVEGG